MRSTTHPVLAAVALLLVAAPHARALNISVQYQPGSFLDSNATARAALEAAASDVSLFISTSLNPTSALFEATYNGTEAYINTSYNYNNPNAPGTLIYGPTSLPADTFLLIAGTENISTGDTLATGSPGGLSVSAGSDAIFNFNDFQTALDLAAAQGSANLARGGGPTIGNLTLTFAPPNDDISFDISYGPGIGAITFDSDTNNAGGTDNATLLNSFWHFDHTTDVHPDKFDFYSVALHEIIHAIGFSSSLTWNTLRTGNDWLGSEVIDLLGTGNNVLNAVGDHIAQSLDSESIVTGQTQKPVMVPSIGNGERRTLTRLDAAFLRDLGWDFALLTGDANNDGVVDAADFLAVEANFGLLGFADGFLFGDANDDGRVDGDDILAIERYFGATLPGLSVPEPATALLLALGGALTLARRRAVFDRVG